MERRSSLRHLRAAAMWAAGGSVLSASNCTRKRSASVKMASIASSSATKRSSMKQRAATLTQKSSCAVRSESMSRSLETRATHACHSAEITATEKKPYMW
eukprot:scaffold294459_cov33-Tisochrysis_lutea.AAC.1